MLITCSVEVEKNDSLRPYQERVQTRAQACAEVMHCVQAINRRGSFRVGLEEVARVNGLEEWPGSRRARGVLHNQC